MLIMRASTTENEDIDGMNSFQRGLKRIGDILGSAIGLVLLSPLFVDVSGKTKRRTTGRAARLRIGCVIHIVYLSGVWGGFLLWAFTICLYFSGVQFSTRIASPRPRNTCG